MEKWQIYITDINGVIYSVFEDMENMSCDLKEHLDGEPVEDFSLELVCCDLNNFESDSVDGDLENKSTIQTYISTWLVMLQ